MINIYIIRVLVPVQHAPLVPCDPPVIPQFEAVFLSPDTFDKLVLATKPTGWLFYTLNAKLITGLLCSLSLILPPLIACPQPVKGAKIKILLNLVPEILNNHRPKSPFISKVLEDAHLTDERSSERVVLCAFSNYHEKNCEFQKLWLSGVKNQIVFVFFLD